MNKINDVELLYNYFISHSHLDPTNTYANNIAQYGTGVGNFLGGLIRTILPIIRKTSMAIGSELVKNSVSKINNELMQKSKIKNEKSSCTKRKLIDGLECLNKKQKINIVSHNSSQIAKSKNKEKRRNKIRSSSKKSVQSVKGSRRDKLSSNKSVKRKKSSSKKSKRPKNRNLKHKQEKDIFSDI
jgi:hypothetical protein